MKKRILSIILVSALMVALLPLATPPALASRGFNFVSLSSPNGVMFPDMAAASRAWGARLSGERVMENTIRNTRLQGLDGHDFSQYSYDGAGRVMVTYATNPNNLFYFGSSFGNRWRMNVGEISGSTVRIVGTISWSGAGRDTGIRLGTIQAITSLGAEIAPASTRNVTAQAVAADSRVVGATEFTFDIPVTNGENIVSFRQVGTVASNELFGNSLIHTLTIVVGAPPIEVTLNDAPMFFDVPPQAIDGRTMVPLRAIFEALGAEVNWNDATQTITGEKDGITVVLPLGSTTPTVNGQTATIDVPAVVQNGRTLVPLRFVAESFGVEVSWDGTTRTVAIFR